MSTAALLLMYLGAALAASLLGIVTLSKSTPPPR